MASTIPHNVLSRLVFKVPTQTLQDALVKKVKLLGEKIDVRRGRVRKIREENRITDEVLIELLKMARAASSASFYTVTSSVRSDPTTQTQEDTVTISAGIVANMMSEEDAMKEELNASDRLATILANICFVEGPVELSFDEVKFLNLS